MTQARPKPRSERSVTGFEAVTTLTTLLLDARADDPMAGLYEAGDIQWWWHLDPVIARSDTVVWFSGAEPIAALMESEQGPRQHQPGQIDIDLVWRPAYDRTVRAEIMPIAIERIASRFDAAPGRVTINVDERDGDFRSRLEEIGCRPVSDGVMVQMWQRPAAPPAAPALPDGMRFDDDRSRPADTPHHLAKRNGDAVADYLQQCSLYRQDLDLSIRTESGEVTAYCLCWLDEGNQVGLFEPVRTEDAWQGQGLGSALISEGIRRLLAAGATLIKVVHEADNQASRRLYERSGFAPAFLSMRYVR